MSAPLAAARAVKRLVAEQLAGARAVTGVGVTRLEDGGFGVRVLLREAAPELVIPPDVDGVPVVVQVIGQVRAQDGDGA
jgi:hypothetical protein